MRGVVVTANAAIQADAAEQEAGEEQGKIGNIYPCAWSGSSSAVRVEDDRQKEAPAEDVEQDGRESVEIAGHDESIGLGVGVGLGNLSNDQNPIT